ncbi:hypothetical protein BJ944DRAFT_246294 [Cunninghamella echinulata]|nr:hypothetical protein BJ944DRAFT_246294 [Cunninghamella echinulata]
MHGTQAMSYNMSDNMNTNKNTNMNTIPPRRIHINPKFTDARLPQFSNTNNQSLNNNNNNNNNQSSSINQALNPSVKRSSNETFINDNELSDRDKKQRRTNNNNYISTSTSKSFSSSSQIQQPSSSSSFQNKSLSSSTAETARIKDSVRGNNEIILHRQRLLEQRRTFTTRRAQDIAEIAREAREKRREFLKTERETLESGEDYKKPIYNNPLGFRHSGVKPIPFTKTSMLLIRGAALAAVESISPSTSDNNNNCNNRSNRYSGTRNGDSLRVRHNSSSNNRVTKNKVPIQQRLGNMNGDINGNMNENRNGNNNNKNNHSALSSQKNNTNSSSNPIPISTNGKSAKLKINYVANDVKDTNLRALEYGSSIKYITFNRERGNAVVVFNSIDNAVNFRRKYNRSLLSGKHISINFCTDSDYFFFNQTLVV